MTHAVRTFLGLLGSEKTTQLAFAQRCGVSHSTISRFVQGRDPTPELLALLCTKWSDPIHGLEMLRAHLIDEIERSGRGISEVQITIKAGPSDTALDRALEILAQQSQQDELVRAMLINLGAMVENFRQRNVDQESAVAEDAAPFNSVPSVESMLDRAEDKHRGGRERADDTKPKRASHDAAAAAKEE